MADEGVVVWYNPRCSKCRGAGELLAAYGVPARRGHYLEDPPELLLSLLETDQHPASP